MGVLLIALILLGRAMGALGNKDDLGTKGKHPIAKTQGKAPAKGSVKGKTDTANVKKVDAKKVAKKADPKAAKKQQRKDAKMAKKAEKKAKKAQKKADKKAKAAKKKEKAKKKETPKKIVPPPEPVDPRLIKIENKGKDGKITVYYKVKRVEKLEKERHAKLHKKMVLLEKKLAEVKKKLDRLSDLHFNNELQNELGHLLNKVHYSGKLTVKVKKQPPKNPLDIKAEMMHNIDGVFVPIKKINSIIELVPDQSKQIGKATSLTLRKKLWHKQPGGGHIGPEKPIILSKYRFHPKKLKKAKKNKNKTKIIKSSKSTKVTKKNNGKTVKTVEKKTVVSKKIDKKTNKEVKTIKKQTLTTKVTQKKNITNKDQPKLQTK